MEIQKIHIKNQSINVLSTIKLLQKYIMTLIISVIRFYFEKEKIWKKKFELVTPEIFTL